jgi:hypothetical protein
MDHVPRSVLDRALSTLTRRSLAERLHAIRALAEVRGVRYVDDAGRMRTIDIALRPWLLISAQLLHFHRTAVLLSSALWQLATLRTRVPALRVVLPFSAADEAWLTLARIPRARPWAVLGRLDSTAIYDEAGWQRDYRMLEPNTVGVGGVHYAPASCSIVLDVLGDVLEQAFPRRAITATPDPRQLLIDELHAVSRRLGRKLQGVAFIENTDFTTGTDEFGELAHDFNMRGLRAVVADPRELRWGRRGLTARGVPVDLLYRDSELSEFVSMERSGTRLSALRQAIQEGRLISGLSWEYDQKSAWEIFTDAQYARYFSPAQRQFFRQHLLWTRLVRDAAVSDPQGRRVALPAYIRRHRQQLVLKPNNLFGGTGVMLGRLTSQREWEAQLQRALRGRMRFVVQQLAHIPEQEFPMFGPSGGVAAVHRHVVSGFYFSSTGIGLVGRFSGKPVVNVSQGGGLIAGLWVH